MQHHSSRHPGSPTAYSPPGAQRKVGADRLKQFRERIWTLAARCTEGGVGRRPEVPALATRIRERHFVPATRFAEWNSIGGFSISSAPSARPGPAPLTPMTIGRSHAPHLILRLSASPPLQRSASVPEAGLRPQDPARDDAELYCGRLTKAAVTSSTSRRRDYLPAIHEIYSCAGLRAITSTSAASQTHHRTSQGDG